MIGCKLHSLLCLHLENHNWTVTEKVYSVGANIFSEVIIKYCITKRAYLKVKMFIVVNNYWYFLLQLSDSLYKKY